MKLNRNFIFIGIVIILLVSTTLGLEVRRESPVDNHIQHLSEQIDAEDWQQAVLTLDVIQSEWSHRRFWIALNNSVQDQQAFDRILSQIRSYIRYTDRVNAGVQAALLHRVWLEFGG